MKNNENDRIKKQDEEEREEIIQNGIEKGTIKVFGEVEKSDEKIEDMVVLSSMTIEELENYKKQLLIQQINEIKGK